MQKNCRLFFFGHDIGLDSECSIVGVRHYFYSAMHFIAKRGIEIACRPSVCPSVCDVGGPDLDNVGWKSWKLVRTLLAQHLRRLRSS